MKHRMLVFSIVAVTALLFLGAEALAHGGTHPPPAPPPPEPTPVPVPIPTPRPSGGPTPVPPGTPVPTPPPPSGPTTPNPRPNPNTPTTPTTPNPQPSGGVPTPGVTPTPPKPEPTGGTPGQPGTKTTGPAKPAGPKTPTPGGVENPGTPGHKPSGPSPRPRTGSGAKVSGGTERGAPRRGPGPQPPAAGPTAPSITKDAMRWQEWWVRNEWIFTRVSKEKGHRSGGVVTEDSLTPEMKTLVRFLLKNLGHGYWDVRAASALALGKVGLNTEPVRRALEKALGDKKDEVAEMAAVALGMVRANRSVFQLRVILRNKRRSRGLRANAALALGLMGDPACLGVLDHVARHEAKDDVRAAAVVALGLVGDDRAAQTLLRISRSRDEAHIAALAITSLGKLDVGSLVVVPGSRKKVSLVRHFEKRLLWKETADPIRQSLAMMMARVGDSGSLAVLERVGVHDRQKAVRAFALLSLARVAARCKKTDRAVRVLASVLGDGKECHPVRAYAALALGLTRSDDAAAVLRKVFASRENAEVRAAAVVGLGMLRDEEALPLLGREINDPRSRGDERRFACIAMGLIGGPSAAKTLRVIVDKVRIPYLRWSAAVGLARLGDTSCLPSLTALLGDGNRVTREGAIRAIGYFRAESTIAALIRGFEKEENQEVQAMYVVSLGYIGDSAERIPVLRKVSQDFNWLAAKGYGAVDFILRVF